MTMTGNSIPYSMCRQRTSPCVPLLLQVEQPLGSRAEDPVALVTGRFASNTGRPCATQALPPSANRRRSPTLLIPAAVDDPSRLLIASSLDDGSCPEADVRDHLDDRRGRGQEEPFQCGSLNWAPFRIVSGP